MLRTLIDNWQKERSGAARLSMRNGIHNYLETQKLEIVEKEIMNLESIREIKIILGAGLRGLVYDMAYKRKLSLMGWLVSAPVSLSNLSEDARELL